MNIKELEDELLKYLNLRIDLIKTSQEVWKYHPKNPEFKNPISEMSYLKDSLDKIEKQIENLEIMIKHVNLNN